MGEVIEVVAVEAKGYRENCENHVDGQNWELEGQGSPQLQLVGPDGRVSVR